ncbi:alpha-L-rhamnosidase-related protein [Flammeovirga agarivorans]|uniref:Glycogen debranching protein n=1 Tax=Flammeovirga agarivorans TaxID=2726742 RepID=A0A7X8SNS8_9BACT|nr:glycogen debranching protein [Flammeovirga agarivorans]NLR93567.1 glycogen debranching protein [Flammeovirga agarivorans]
MNRTLRLLAAGCLMAFTACDSGNENTLYESETYNVYKDHVTQGDFTATVVSPKEMTSNYKSPLQDAYSRAIEFKFSINGKDDELAYGKNHRLVIHPEDGNYTSPTIVFGEHHLDDEKVDKMDWLEKNTEVTIKLDMSPVLNAFKTKGYYEDIHGEKIYQNDFKGVYVAGGSAPMRWDFDNLGDVEQLTDKDGDGIYEITLVMNQPDPEKITSPVWKSTKNLSKYPTFTSDIPLVDALYNLALNELVADSEADGTFRTGKEWGGVWTRDISYSIVLSLSILDPQRAITSLRRKVKRDRIIQDTGSGGAWPVSSDRVTWALAAWNVYTTTGDQGWLKEAYKVIANTIDDDMHVVYDPATGLMRGESSFLDWRKQTYPRWMDNVDIYRSLNLGTNVDHFEAMNIAARMARLLGKEKDYQKYNEYAVNLKNAINNHLWLEKEGYYAQYLYGRDHMILSPKYEALGEALAVIFDVADENRAKSIVENSPITPYGAACVYPQIPGIRPYHNNGIWPFVQAYWNIATAKAGNGTALEQGLASIYRPAALFLTNKENFVAEDGDYMDTEVNSDEMLWSLSGNMAMIYKVYFGISIDEKGILSFNPVVPKVYGGSKELKNVKLWKNNFDITLKGYGSKIKSFTIDGKASDEFTFNLKKGGNHKIDIVLADNDITEGTTSNKVANKFHLENPNVTYKGDQLTWKAVKGAVNYEIIKNGKVIATQNETSFTIKKEKEVDEYAVRAIDSDNFPSYISEPISVGDIKIKNVSRIASASKKIDIKAAPSGMVEVSKKRNKKVDFKITVPESGEYMVWFSYTNGSGPWNTDNKCAIRNLFVNGTDQGALVMAQRGTEEWSSIGMTNHIPVQLKKGANKLSIRFESYDENMNVDVNTALIENVYYGKASK